MDALYQAIEDAPEDPGPRLVLADWLQSNGDPRGLLIAAQHALRADPDDIAMRANVAKVFRRHPELLPSCEALGFWSEQIDCRWAAGFVDRLTFALPGWFNDNRVADHPAVELVKHPSCRFLRELVMLCQTDAPGPEILAELQRIRPGLAVRCCPVAQDEGLAEALAEPASIRWAEVHTEESLALLCEVAPDLVNLELLEIRTYGLETLPDGLGAIPALRRLDVSWCRALREIPPDLLANPSLVYLQMYDCTALEGYEMVRINQLLAGLERVHAGRHQRAVEMSLLIGRDERADELASTEDLLRALDSNMATVRKGAIRLLEQRIRPLRPEGNVVLAGSFDLRKTELKALLRDAGATPTTRIKPDTSAVLLGENPKGRGLEALRAGLTLGLERDVLELRSDEVAEADEGLVEDLRSRDPGRCGGALDRLQHGVLSDPLIAEVLAVAHDTAMDKSIRKTAKKLFAVAASPELQAAAAAQFKQSPLVSGEAKRAARIRAIEAAAPEFDALTFSIALCVREGCAFTLILERCDEATLRDLLGRRIEEGHLSMYDVPEIPEVLADLPIRSLSLACSHHTELPEVVTRMASLEKLDISENQLTTLPDLSGTRLRHLDAWNNRFREVPETLRKLSLVELDLSADRVQLAQLPSWFGELRSLRRLDLRGQRFRELPDSLFELGELEELSLLGCSLPPVDDRVQGWKSLKKLDVDYSDWSDDREVLQVLLPACELGDR